MQVRRGYVTAAFLLGAIAIAVSSCQRTQPQQPTYGGGYYPQPQQPYPQPGGPQPGAPTSPTPNPNPNQPGPAPTPATPALAPALGFPCVSDADIHCHFAHCIQGKCGGCTNESQCKNGATCSATLFGAVCLAGGSPTPSAPPVPTTPPPTPTAPPSNDPLAAARQSCLDKTNAFRAKVGVAAVTRRLDREVCADEQATNDARANAAHATFAKCGEASQNECPAYPGPIENVLTVCLQQMFDEGPGEPYSAHGHFINMTNREFRQVACGFHTTADGRVWVVQDFFR